MVTAHVPRRRISSQPGWETPRLSARAPEGLREAFCSYTGFGRVSVALYRGRMEKSPRQTSEPAGVQQGAGPCVQATFDFWGNIGGRGWSGAPLGPRILRALRGHRKRRDGLGDGDPHRDMGLLGVGAVQAAG